jgi:hypothetical protein
MKTKNVYEKLNNTSAILTSEAGPNNNSVLGSSDKDLSNADQKTPEKKMTQLFDSSVLLSPDLMPNDKTLDEISIDPELPRRGK